MKRKTIRLGLPHRKMLLGFLAEPRLVMRVGKQPWKAIGFSTVLHLGKVSNMMSIATNFGHKHFHEKKNFQFFGITNFEHFDAIIFIIKKKRFSAPNVVMHFLIVWIFVLHNTVNIPLVQFRSVRISLRSGLFFWTKFAILWICLKTSALQWILYCTIEYHKYTYNIL